jgi:hypothetical protein
MRSDPGCTAQAAPPERYARYEDLEGANDVVRISRREVWDVNHSPHEDVVIKAGCRRRDHHQSAASGMEFNAFDPGIGSQS